MQLMQSGAIYNTSERKTAFPFSIANFIRTHKSLSLISLAILVTLSAWMLSLGAQHTGASSNSSTAQSAANQSTPEPAASSTTVNTSTTQTSGETSTQVNVNGQNIPVPENGTVEQTIPGNNNQSNVHVKINNQTSGDGNSSSSSTLQIMSNSSSQTEGGSLEE